MTQSSKYHSWNAKAQTWDYIENRYIEDWQGKHERLLELARHIKNSDLSLSLVFMIPWIIERKHYI